MKPEKLKFFKELLLNQKEELLTKEVLTISGMKVQEYYYTDFIDKAVTETNQEITFRIMERQHKLIEKIDLALERIEDGTFGICDICEEEISLKRLEARPVATRCIRCKTQEEAYEKMYR